MAGSGHGRKKHFGGLGGGSAAVMVDQLGEGSARTPQNHKIFLSLEESHDFVAPVFEWLYFTTKINRRSMICYFSLLSHGIMLFYSPVSENNRCVRWVAL